MQKTIEPLTVEPARTGDQDAAFLIGLLSETLEKLTGSSGQNSFDPSDVTIAGSLFVIARNRAGKAVGCGAYRRIAPEVAELKRMFALPGTKGVGKAVLEFLERSAAKDGYREIWLETRLVNERAMNFYLKHGFQRISNYGKYAGNRNAACFGKVIAVE